MDIIDGHCDVLYKLYEHPELDFFAAPGSRREGGRAESRLDVTYAGLSEAGVKVQCFAIYLPERITQPHFDHYLEYIDLFRRRIAADPRMRAIRTRGDLEAVMQGGQIGALLTLEGADALQANPLYTRTLYALGVRLIGTTWNYGNWAADGVLEPRQGGFTRRGKAFIKECGELGITLDVSHLSERAFWDLADTATGPFVATHSNAYSVCAHPRNLTDDQLRELIRRDGRIGITFVPWFVKAGGAANIDDVLRHIDHVCALGGERQLTFGSDFDGIDKWVAGLGTARDYVTLTEALLKRYNDTFVRQIAGENWLRFLRQQLPEGN